MSKKISLKHEKIAEKAFLVLHNQKYYLATTFPYRIFNLNTRNRVEANRLGRKFIKDNKKSLFSNDYDYKGFYAIEWLITTDCNLNCKHCFAKKNNEEGRYGIPKGTMTYGELTASVDWGIVQFRKDLEKSGFKSGRFEIFIIGGEPLLAFDLIKKGLKYLNSKLDKVKKDMALEKLTLGVMLVTNGLLIDDKIADFIAKEGIEVAVSVDSPYNIVKVDKEGKNYTPKAIEGVKTLIAHGAKDIALNIVISTKDLKDLDRVFDYIAGFGIMDKLSTIQMSPKIPPHRQTSFCGCKPTEVIISDYGSDFRKCKNFADKMIKYSKKYKMDIKKYHSRMNHLLKVGGLAYRCPGAQWRICVVPGGDVYPCQQLVNIDGFKMGNMHSSKSKLTKSMKPVIKKFRDRLVFKVEPCNKCPLQTICIVFVDCPARCYLENGDMYKVPKHYCEIAKDYLYEIYCEFIDSREKKGR